MSVVYQRNRSTPASGTPRAGAMILVAVLPLLVGCYSMRPVDLSEVSPGEEVVVHLDVDASRRMSAQEGYDVRSVPGRLESSSASSIVLSTPVGRRVQGVIMDDTRRVFTLERPDVVLVERREFNRNRSALVGAALAGGLIWGVLQFSGGGGSGPDGGGEPPPPAPSFRIRIPLPH